MALEKYKHTNPEGISDKTFLRFSKFIQSELGIKMPAAKKTMLQARLQKRIRLLGIHGFDEYYDYVFSDEGMEGELPNLLDTVTTNKTDFFREPRHFEYLTQTALPELCHACKPGERKEILAWSAGCSTGEEPYTLAMVLSEFTTKNPGVLFTIYATDISTKVLKDAALGIYEQKAAEPIPETFRKKYFLKSKDQRKGLVRIVPELRKTVRFGQLNFMENKFHLPNDMDIIFCRNVIIYFAKQTQETVLNRLCEHLKPGGYMFLGHSETLNGMNVPLIPTASTIYKKPL